MLARNNIRYKSIMNNLSHKQGVVVLQDDQDAMEEMRGWGRRFAYFTPDQRSFVVPEYHINKYAKRHKRAIRRHDRFLAEIFSSDSSVIQHGNDDCGITIPLNDDVLKIVSADVRTEVYHPVAYHDSTGLKGGTHAYFWPAATNQELEKNGFPSLLERPISSVVTGMCMFGTNLIGFDSQGRRHPLTNTFYKMPEDSIIVEVPQVPENHPYEEMMIRLFANQLLFYKALGGGKAPVIRYQSVLEEYVFYGLERFLKGEMTWDALIQYTECIKLHVERLLPVLGMHCRKLKMPWDSGESTLAGLFSVSLRNAPADEALRAFLSDFGVKDPALLASTSKNARNTTIQTIVSRCLERLSSQGGTHGEVWSHVCNSIQSGEAKLNSEHSGGSLLSINYLNYGAKVAVATLETNGTTCLSHPYHEKAMALSYKAMHADRFGSILCVNWISPIFSHGSFKDSLYYLEENKEAVNVLIQSGLVEYCAMETGAVAIGNKSKADYAVSQISALLNPLDIAL